MSFHMPSVDFNLVPIQWKEVIKLIIEQNKLAIMPKWNCSDFSKMIHHFLLKGLYRDTRWSVPFHCAWGMPHCINLNTDIVIEAEQAATEIIRSECFIDPQPVLIYHKHYLVTKNDGSTFVMKVN